MRRAAEGGKLASALTAVNCLAIAAATNEPEEASALIDLVKALKVEKKELLIFTEGTDLSSWPTLNKSINFNVVISRSHHLPTGHSRPRVAGNTISICPVIGRVYPEMHRGSACPQSTRTLAGRRLQVSFIGIDPYIKRTRPPSGSEVAILEVMAKKLDFSFELMPARGFDVAEINGTKVGMMHRASICTGSHKTAVSRF